MWGLERRRDFRGDLLGPVLAGFGAGILEEPVSTDGVIRSKPELLLAAHRFRFGSPFVVDVHDRIHGIHAIPSVGHERRKGLNISLHWRRHD